jgi:hypothetical protein
LNQANRGDLVRSPTRAKLAKFIGQLNEGADPTSLWYFLSIHDTMLFPLVEFLNWKERIDNKNNKAATKRTRETQDEQGDTGVTSTSTTTNQQDEAIKRARLEV